MDGFNERVRYTLTSGVKAMILKAYPSVKQEQLKLVPNRMTEEEFWNFFLFSHYLDPKKTTTNWFTDCDKNDQKGSFQSQTVINKMFNLSSKAINNQY